MKPYYSDEWITIYHGDCREILPEIPDKSIDFLATDPPYGIGFMGKDWDRALPDKRIWAECFRVLKPGAFAFVMSIPRSDCLSRMIISLEDAGFWVNFTPIFWAYASGFPKAQNIGKAVDKRLGVDREVIGKNPCHREVGSKELYRKGATCPEYITKGESPLEGSYGGFQPKPAVEVIIVAMKPLSEKTFVDQALKNGKGITWLDDGRIPYESEGDKEVALQKNQGNALINRDKLYGGYGDLDPNWQKAGRFPANLLVSDDVLNDGFRKTSSHYSYQLKKAPYEGGWKSLEDKGSFADSGSFSRYFDLDKWVQKTFPFLIVPKASKSEKNRGCEDLPLKHATALQFNVDDSFEGRRSNNVQNRNYHPTVKPLKLMSYLIILGSRVGDIILDPFGGSGTTALASKLLGRHCIISEIEEKYCEISANRCRQSVMELKL